MRAGSGPGVKRVGSERVVPGSGLESCWGLAAKAGEHSGLDQYVYGAGLVTA